MAIMEAPQGRWVKILIETFQRRAFLKQSGDKLTTLRTRETWQDDPDWPELKRAYTWMRTEYAHRRIALDPRQALLWGWPSPFVEGRYKKRNNPRSASVRLWVEVPEALVLASDFGVWHVILNDARFLDETQPDLPLAEDWEKLFDGSWLAAHEFAGPPGTDDQVVFPYIRREWIQKVKYFRGQY
jgi:hypothetical protein